MHFVFFKNIFVDTKIKDRLIILGLLLLPISLSTGPLFPEIILILISLLFLYQNLKLRFEYDILNIVFVIFFLFYILILLRSIFSDNPILSLESSIFYFRFFFLILVTHYILLKYNYFLKYFLYALIATCLFVILKQFFLYYSYSINDYFMSFFISSEVITNNIFNSNSQMPGLYEDEKVTGSFLSRLFPIILSLFVFKLNNNNYSKFLLLFLIVLFSITIFFSGERSAFFNFVFIFLIFTIYCKKWRVVSIYFITLCFLSVFIFYSLTLGSTNNKSLDYTNKFENLITLTKQKMINSTINQIDFNSNNILQIYLPHQNIYITAYNIYKDNKIFGVGPKMFRKVCSYEKYKIVDGCSSHPHNSLLQILSETGLIGFIFYFLVIFFCVYVLVKKLYLKMIFPKENYYGSHIILILSAILMNLNPLLPSGNFFHNWLNFIYYIPIGFLFYFLKNSNYE